MAEKYPSGAYLLLLIGGILGLLGGILTVLAIGMTAQGNVTVIFMFIPLTGAMAIVCAIWPLIWSILIIVAATMVKKGDKESVRKGAILGLIASILGVNIISLIGAILAFMWKPPAPPVTPPPPA